MKNRLLGLLKKTARKGQVVRVVGGRDVSLMARQLAIMGRFGQPLVIGYK